MYDAAMDQATLKQTFHYDRKTGVFTYLHGPRAGKVAGSIDAKGYVVLCVRGTVMKAHRAAWLYVKGELPPGIIDHRDGNRANNAFRNLRPATYAFNRQNLKGPAFSNASGFLGVVKVGRRFYATIRVDGKRIALGGHATAEEASAAYLKAKRRLHKFCTI